VFVAVVIEDVMRMPDIVVCGLSGCTIFFRIISQTSRFLKNVIEYEKCASILSRTLFWNISHLKKHW